MGEENKIHLNSGPGQMLTLQAFTAFALQAGDVAGLGGKLVALCGFGREGVSAALGATLAGAACLGMDADAAAVKAAMREGGCDFMVNSLDEALRILKNEVRKRRPVSVGVPCVAAEMLAAMVERGVQPDLLLAEDVPAMRTLVERGAVLMDLTGPAVGEWALRMGYELVRFEAGSFAELKAFDAAALAAVPAEDWVRRRWLEAGPKYFRRGLVERWVWLSGVERSALRAD